LSGDTVLALVSGGFEEDRAGELLAEAERCADCSLLVHEAGRALAEGETDGSHTLPWLDAAGVLRVGSIVAARFRVLRLLGRGGMGEVYEALDNELGELVALKTIRTSHATRTSSIERFRQEVRLARRVVHPHVCRVLEFGRHQVEGAEPVYFLTMELLRGELLSRHLRRRSRLSSLESLAIARQICAGLNAIHAQGVLHRDIKPSNVMLCSAEDEVDSQEIAPRGAVLLDFGIARSLALGTTARSHGALIGTPDYMAPEQLQAQTLTPATDIYALGIVLFELLAGELPFAADPTLTRALKRLQGAPPVASTGAAELPSKLTRLVARCLEVAPSDRPPSAAALLHELTELEQELSDASAPSRSLRAEGKRGTAVFSRARWFIACAMLAGIGAFIALRSQATTPSAAVVSALPSQISSRPASPPTSANVRPPLPSSREPAVVGGAANLPNEQLMQPPAQRAVSEPSRGASKAARSAAATDRARPTSAVERSCSPPYYFDGDGFRVYRKECL
jgi:serine/threonine protein kinase